MSTVIRLARYGCKKNPFYRIIAIDNRKKTTGLPKQQIGHYNPSNKSIQLDIESYEKWIACGAKASKTVAAIANKYKQNNA